MSTLTMFRGKRQRQLACGEVSCPKMTDMSFMLIWNDHGLPDKKQGSRRELTSLAARLRERGMRDIFLYQRKEINGSEQLVPVEMIRCA